MTKTRSATQNDNGTQIALVWAGGHDVEVRDVPVPQPREGSVVVDVAYTGLCGTDLHICAGEHPRAQPGLVIGHEIAGTVHADAAGWRAGTKVVVNPLVADGVCRNCLAGRFHNCSSLRLLGIDAPGGATAQVLVPADGLVAATASADLRLLAFAEPLAVAVRAVGKARVELADRVLIAGAGPVGLAVARCAQLAGAATVAVVEPSPSRRHVATDLGFEVAEEMPDSGDYDVLFDAAAHPAVAASIIAAAAELARIVLVGVYGAPAAMNLQAATFKEVSIIGTRVYSRTDLATAVDMIASGRFDPTPLLTSTVNVAEAPEAIAQLRTGAGIKTLVRGTPS